MGGGKRGDAIGNKIPKGGRGGGGGVGKKSGGKEERDAAVEGGGGATRKKKTTAGGGDRKKLRKQTRLRGERNRCKSTATTGSTIPKTTI